MPRPVCVALTIVLVTAGCSGGEKQSFGDGGEKPPFGDGGAPGGDADTPEPIVASDLGAICAAGCLGDEELCVVPSEACPRGHCLFDSRSEQAYCSADCTRTSCPDLYVCMDVAGTLRRACAAEAAVCGDGRRQRGEVCDDGNTLPSDGCSADCLRLEEPPLPARHFELDISVTGERYDDGIGGLVPVDERFELIADATDSLSACGDIAAGDVQLFNRIGITGLLGQTVSVRLCFTWGKADVTLAVPFVVGTHQINDATPLLVIDAARPSCAAVFSSTNLSPQATQITSSDSDGDPVIGSAQRTLPFVTMLDSATRGTTEACDALRSYYGDAWTIDASFTATGTP